MNTKTATKKIKGILQEVFQDTSVSQSVTIERLKSIKQDLDHEFETLIDCLDEFE